MTNRANKANTKNINRVFAIIIAAVLMIQPLSMASQVAYAAEEQGKQETDIEQPKETAEAEDENVQTEAEADIDQAEADKADEPAEETEPDADAEEPAEETEPEDGFETEAETDAIAMIGSIRNVNGQTMVPWTQMTQAVIQNIGAHTVSTDAGIAVQESHETETTSEAPEQKTSSIEEEQDLLRGSCRSSSQLHQSSSLS